MVEQCNPHQHEPGSGGHVWVDPYGRYHGIRNFPYTAGFLGVTYTNNAKKAAREVDFGLVSRGSLIAVRRDTRKYEMKRSGVIRTRRCLSRCAAQKSIITFSACDSPA